MDRKSSELMTVNEILAQRVINHRQPVLTLLDLVKKWPEIVGDLIAENVSPVRIKRTTLILQAASSVWANELQLMEPRLIKEINQHCPHLKIEKLRFVSS